jgi:hypothetical protein
LIEIYINSRIEILKLKDRKEDNRMEESQVSRLYTPKKSRKKSKINDLFRQLFYFEKKATKKERVMFFI